MLPEMTQARKVPRGDAWTAHVEMP